MAKNPYSDGACRFQVLGGCVAVSVTFTIDLIPLNPYFHGTISRTGAPS